MQKKYIQSVVDITVLVGKADLKRIKVKCFSYITLYMLTLDPGLI